jgi:hypothetical protein
VGKKVNNQFTHSPAEMTVMLIGPTARYQSIIRKESLLSPWLNVDVDSMDELCVCAW